MAQARVRPDGLGAVTLERAADRPATPPAPRQTGQRVLRGAMPGLPPDAAHEALLHGEPRGLVDDTPLRHVDGEHLRRIGLHARDALAVADLLHPTVDVHAVIARV